MNGRAVAYAIGKLLQLTAVILFVPLGIAVFDLIPLSLASTMSSPETVGFILAIVACLVIGTAISFFNRSEKNEQFIREGYAIVTFGWIIFALMGCIPLFLYFLSQSPVHDAQGVFLAFTNAFFEIMSGFTTTGATILTDIEAMPDSLLFWRSLTHWLGGMGIITLALVIFPAMGVSGYTMFRGEIPGPSADRLRPRLAQTATVLWGVYAGLSLLEVILLLFGGMDLFDSLCHTFGTMATGGFSTENQSIAAYHSAYIEWVIIIFMFLAGVNFLLHYSALRGRLSEVFSNREFIFYTRTVIVVAVFLAILLGSVGLKPAEKSYDHYRIDISTQADFEQHVAREEEKFTSFHSTIRTSLFQALAIITTTGYGTADFDLWPDIARILLLTLMFFGGCAGSTGGGMKQIRILVLIKTGWRELRRLTQPKLIAPLRVGEVKIDEDRIVNIVSFFILFMMLFVLSSIAMTLFVPDMMTAISATASCINNIGPGLNGVGSIENYSWIPIPGKWVLIFCMLLGRLEIFTVLIVFRPSFWK